MTRLPVIGAARMEKALLTLQVISKLTRVLKEAISNLLTEF